MQKIIYNASDGKLPRNFSFARTWIILLMAIFSLGIAPTWAQTDRIPVADGAFSNGASFAANNWSVSNGTNNAWVVASGHGLGAPFAGDAAYVSSSGTTYTYNNALNAQSYFWRDVTVPAGETAMNLTFDWNSQGEASWDIWQVFVGPNTITPVGANTHPGSGTNNVPTTLTGATYIGNGSPLTGLQVFSGTIPASFAGTTFRVFFVWKSDNSVGTTPPAAIDNIRLTSAFPVAPVCNTTYFPVNGASNVAANPVLTWSGNGGLPAPTSTVYFGTNAALVAAMDPSVRVLNASAATTYATTTVLNTTYYWMVVPANSAGGPTSCIVNSFSTPPPANFNALGGLWNSPQSWAGNVVPAAGNDVTIPAGVTMYVNQVLNYRDLNIDGTLAYASTNTMTLTGNLTISATGRFLGSTAAPVAQTITIGGNLVNNGYANLSVSSLIFNGTGSYSISGSGTFESGAGTRGIIRQLNPQNLGDFSVTTTQDLAISFATVPTCNNYIPNNKVFLNNSADAFKGTVDFAVVTNMGSAYGAAPYISASTAALWAPGAIAANNVRITSTGNVYVALSAGTAATFGDPVHTDFSVQQFNSIAWLHVGSVNTIGTALGSTVTAGAQVFWNGRLFTIISGAYPTGTAAAIQTAWNTALSAYTPGVGNLLTVGTAQLRDMGTPATVAGNYDGTNLVLRSIAVTSGGSGYTSIPVIAIVPNGSGSGALATASMWQLAGGANTVLQKATATNITGPLNIGSSTGPVGAGVASLTTTGYGRYGTAPTVGFTLPTIVNLVTAQGSGYTTAPTVTVSGGSNVNAGTNPTFTVNVAQGRIISIYVSAAGTAQWSVAPTLTITGGGGSGATASFATSLPTATANLNPGGQISSFTITNQGYGYAAVPTAGLSAAAAGEFAATAPTARLLLFNLQWGFYFPQTNNPSQALTNCIPTNNRVNAITISAGVQSLSANLELYSSTPLTLTSGSLDINGNTLTCSSVAYAGAAGTVGSNLYGGKVRLTLPGGIAAATRTFPMGGGTGANPQFIYNTGSSLAATLGTTGYTFTTLTFERTGVPSGTVTSGGNVVGTRTARLTMGGTGTLSNNNTTLRTVQYFYNGLDAIVSDNQSLFVAEATSLTGPWQARSAAGTAGTLATTGSRTTATTGNGPITDANDYFFAWVVNGFTPPPPLQYNVARSTANSYNSIADVALGGDGTGLTTTFGSGDDGISPVISLADPSNAFTYQGQQVTGFRISTNGNIQLQTAGGATGSNQWTNNFADVNLLNVIAPFWEDLTANPNSVAGAQNNVRYKITGTAPNRTVIVDWANMTVFGLAGPQLFFQVVLTESNNNIRINYGNMQLYNGTQNVRYSYSNGLKGRYAGAYPAAGQVFACLYENTANFSHEQTQIAGYGANGLAISPEPRSSYLFTPAGSIPGYTIPVAPTQPNDEAATAITLPALSVFPNNIAWNSTTNSSNLFSTRYATSSAEPVCGGPSNKKDVWFKFTANEVNVTVRVYPSGGFLPRIQVLDNTLTSTLACVAGTSSNVQTDAVLTGLTIGQNYYVRVSHDLTGVTGVYSGTNVGGTISGVSINNGGTNYTVASTVGGAAGSRFVATGGGANTFVGGVTGVTAGVVTAGIFDGGFGYTSTPSITVESPDWGITGEFGIIVYSPPINDDCSGAIALTSIATNNCVTSANQLVGQSTASATPSSEAAPTCGTADDDLWYKFVATGASTQIDVTGVIPFDPSVQIWSQVAGNCASKVLVSCTNATGAGAVETITLATTPGTTYFMRIFHAGTGSGGGGGTFTICVKTPTPLCSSTIVPLDASVECGGNPTTIAWSTAPTATAYDVYFDAGAGPATTLVGADILVENYNLGVLAAGTYTYKVIPKNANGSTPGGCADHTFSVISPAPTGNTPASRCGYGTVTLQGTGSNLRWWSHPTSNSSLVGSGASFTTPPISVTTPYYLSAGAVSTGLTQLGTDNTVSSTTGFSPFSTFYNGQSTDYLIRAQEMIDAGMAAGNITSMAFIVGTPGGVISNYNITMAHTANTDLSAGLGVPNGPVTAVFSSPAYTVLNGVNTLNFSNNFNWDGVQNVLVHICASGGTFTSNASITRSATSFASTYGYYSDTHPFCTTPVGGTDAGSFLFRPNIIFNGQAICSGPRVQVDATITPAPPLSLDASTATNCQNTSTGLVSLTSTAGDYTTYTWSPNTNVTGNQNVGWTFNPNTGGTTVYTLSSSGFGCTGTPVTVTVTTNLQPPAGTATISSANPICEGQTTQLNATGFNGATAFAETMDGSFPLTSFAVAAITGGPYTATADNVYFAQGTKSVRFNTAAVSSNGTLTAVANVDLSSYTSAQLTFKHIAAMESPTTSFDYGIVEYSSNGGTTWTQFQAANYTGTANATLFSGGVRFSTRSYPNWITQFTGAGSVPTVGPSLWQTETFSVPVAALTNQFKIRFRYTTDISTNFYGWLIDDVKIDGLATASYAWTSVNGYTSAVQNPNFATTMVSNGDVFTVTATNPANCFRTASTPALTVVPAPVITVTGSAPHASTCANGPVVVSGVSGNSSVLAVSWSIVGPAAGSITSGSTTYTPTYTPGAGDAGNSVTLRCSVTSSASPCATAQFADYVIFVRPTPTFTVSNDIGITADYQVCNTISPADVVYRRFDVVSPQIGVDYEFAPAGSLYTDAALSIPYVFTPGSGVTQVYAVPFGTVNFTLTATEAGCTTNASSVTLSICSNLNAGICTAPTVPVTNTGAFALVNSNANISITGDVFLPACSPTGGQSKEGYLKVIVPASGELHVTTFPGTNAISALNITNPIVQILHGGVSGTCSSVTPIACDDDGAALQQSYVSATGLAPGSEAYIRIIRPSSIVSSAQFVRVAITDGLLWKGTVSNDFNNAANWLGGDATALTKPQATPANAVRGVIIRPGTNNPTVTGSGTVKRLNLIASGALSVAAASSLNVKENILMASNTVAGTGNVIMNGTTAQTITGPGRLNYLRIDNTAGVSVSGVVRVGGLDLKTGALTTGGNLTILSDAGLTGYINNFSAGNTGTLVGNVNMERRVVGSGNVQHYLSTPVAHSSTVAANYSDDFSVVGTAGYVYSSDPTAPQPATFPTTWWYNETLTNVYTPGWTNASQVVLAPGQGFAANISGTKVIDAVGTLTNGANTGTIAKSLTFTDDGFNLVGNPYPSSISFNQLVAENSSLIYPQLYIWNGAGSNYASYNGVVWTNNPAGSLSSDIMGHSQSWFVIAQTSGTLNFNNTQRTTSSPANFFTEQPGLIRLEVATEAGKDEVVVYNDNNSTENFDALVDAKKFLGAMTPVSAFTLSKDNMPLAINAMDKFDAEQVIPVQIVTENAGMATIKLNLADLKGNYDEVYLEDATLNKFVDLKANESYTAQVSKGNSGSRFFLHFNNKKVADAASNSLNIYANDSKVFVNIPTEGNTRIEVMNVLGQNLVTLDANSFKGLKEVSVPNAVTGSYLVKVTNAGKVYTQKVVLTAK